MTRASVTIVFDNSDKSKAPVGFEQMPEISVTRQVSCKRRTTNDMRWCHAVVRLTSGLRGCSTLDRVEWDEQVFDLWTSVDATGRSKLVSECATQY